MRILSLRLFPAALALLAQGLFAALPLVGSHATAQEPPPPATEATPLTQPPAASPTDALTGRQRPRRQVLVLEAGTVHPVAGPPIENGIVVVRGERILAIGKKGEVDVPPNAIVHSFPTGHIYPGLVDAASDAFTDGSLRNDGSLDAGAAFADDLRLRYTRDDELARAGITTAYITVRSPSMLRGQGAIVRPRQSGFELWSGHEHAAVQMRMTEGLGASHPLQRQQQLQSASNAFEGLDEFRKARTDHDEALAKYKKEFDEYLAWHQKKKDADKPADKKEGDKPATTPPTDAPAAPAEGERPIRRGNRPGGEPRREPPKDGDVPPAAGPSSEEIERALATLLAALAQEPTPIPPKQDPPQNPPQGPGSPVRRGPSRGGAPAPQTPDGPPSEEKKDEAPKRPTYPKPPARDPQKEALLRVLDGELALRVEAHRADELHAALRLQTERSIPLLILEQAYGADTLAEAIARQGASVVLTDVLPSRLPKPYDSYDVVALPAKLQAAGVPFAIASGSARRASLLPMMAAAAVGRGLDREIALRAITLTPAELLGVAKDTGSLQVGKFADVLVCDRPLFATDSRVLLVLAKGRTEFEAK